MLYMLDSREISMDLSFHVSVSSFCIVIKREYCIKYLISAPVNTEIIDFFIKTILCPAQSNQALYLKISAFNRIVVLKMYILLQQLIIASV